MKWLGITIFLILLGLILFKTKESFNAMNVFQVPLDDSTITPAIPKFPINDASQDLIGVDIEQNKDVFDSDLKDMLVYLTQKRVENVNGRLKVFKDSIEKIFVDKEFKNLVFNINVYDTLNFFVYKIKVYISSETKIDKNCKNCSVKIIPIEDIKIDSFNFVPVEEPSVPIYFRILNTLHLFDPFKTSSSLFK